MSAATNPNPDRDANEDQIQEPPAAPEKPQVREDDDGNVIVSVPDTTARKPRKERREDFRQDRVAEEAKRWRDENDSLRLQVRQMEAQLQQRLGQMERQISQPREPSHTEQVRALRAQQETIQQALRSGAITTEQEAQRLREQFYELDGQVESLRENKIKREAKREALEEFQRSRQPGEYAEATLRDEYPEVINHPQAIRWANGKYHQLVAEGKPATLATSREALNAAAERYSLRAAPLPVASDVQRQKFGSVPNQAGTKNTGNEITLSKEQKRMAIARWPRDDEHVAYAKMAVLMRKMESTGSGTTNEPTD